MNVEQLIYEINETVENFINDNATLVPASRVGLDSRCGSLFVGDQFVATRGSNTRSIEYYGGFEYIDAEMKKQMGEYTLYTTYGDDRCRVQNVIDAFEELPQEECD